MRNLEQNLGGLSHHGCTQGQQKVIKNGEGQRNKEFDTSRRTCAIAVSPFLCTGLPNASTNKKSSVWTFSKNQLQQTYKKCFCCICIKPDAKQSDHEKSPKVNSNNKHEIKKTIKEEIIYSWSTVFNTLKSTQSVEKVVETPPQKNQEPKKPLFSLPPKTEAKNVSPVCRGIKNQGATCYLNSFIQVMFHTPEFRNELLELTFPNDSGDDNWFNVAYQLQRLFVELLGPDTSAVKTNGLTKSLDWTQEDTDIQQDVQEFGRYFLGILDEKLQLSSSANMISHLFSGIQVEYLTCTMCNISKEQYSTFFDISLPIRSIDGKTSYDSLEYAIEQYLRPEILDEHFCDICGKKSKFLKGQQFKELPYILCFHLGRINYNINSLKPEKINDKVSFPFFISMDVDGYNSIFELYGVIIHKGEATFGHYFSYIKDFKSGQWFECNDDIITLIPPHKIESTFSGKSSAYMIMYRLFDRNRNREAYTIDELPAHLNLRFTQVKLIKELNVD
ncbi:ubiquitin carboxyl-terminal hydrolase 47-like [Daktulosphaira vitifoliae]|uniref:ubiquitin carboxyl-terminal hydrolase 47-like n=1 Tax=Daktulosphaira vitifoliae TaxID=58002 RepID=UPI0021AAC2F3|nr:ubiquitin carboxyl-terminal hydrolase 47-like [Daktulosphaira vitifoliae]